MLRRLFRRFVDIRESERRVVGSAALVMFAMVSGHMLLETARDALFLGRLDAARLPIVYAALAGLAVLAIAASDRIVARAGQRNALIATLVLSVYGTLLFYLLPISGPVVFALYLWSALIGSVVVIQFWIFVGQLFTVDQGKRVFGILAAGGALGALVGAGAAAFLLRLIELQALLLVGAAMFVIAAATMTTFPVNVSAAESSTKRAKTQTRLAVPRMLRRYPYLLRLGALLVIATATVLIVDFMFKQSAAERLSADELGAFFATYYAIFAAASLIFQLVGANFLLRRIGVLASLAVMPLLLLIGGAATVIVGGALIATSATKGVDGAMRHSLHRVSTELLWMPLPAAVRSRAKGIFDSGLSRAVQAATAGGLLALTAFGLDSAAILGGIIAGLTALWLMLAAGLRRPYLELYRRGLSRGQPSPLVDLNLKSLEVLVEALSSADDREVIAAMKLLAAKGRARLIPSLILYHSSERVLSEALALVATDERDDWIPIAHKLLERDSDVVRADALRALARRGRLPDLSDRLVDISTRVRAQALFWKVQASDLFTEASDEPAVAEIVEGRGDDSGPICELLASIASDGDGRWSQVVLACLEDDDPQIAELAIGATSALRDARFIPILIARLASRHGRGAVRSALTAHGPAALDALDRAFRDPTVLARARLHLPRSVGLFRSELAVFLLLEQLGRERDGGVRFRILSALSRLVVELGSSLGKRVPLEPILAQLERDVREYFRLLALSAPLERKTYEMPSEAVESADLVHGLIGDKKRQSIERCFLLLQISHPREDVASIAAAISSGDARLRANALEFVDNMMIRFRRSERGNEIRTWLALALDDLSTEAKLQRVGDLVTAAATYDEALVSLAKDSDATTAAVAVYHALLLDVEHLRRTVAQAVAERPLLDPLGAELHERLTGEAKSA